MTPLHVFETRYRQLMRDLMDGNGRFVMAPCDPSLPRDPQTGGAGAAGAGLAHTSMKRAAIASAAARPSARVRAECSGRDAARQPPTAITTL